MDPFMGPSSDTLFSGWGPPKTFLVLVTSFVLLGAVLL
jgi:hypothetical protein